MTDHSHHYTLDLVWTGNRGEGTKTYQGYGRDHRVTLPGKPEIMMSSDATGGPGGRSLPSGLA